MTDITELVQPLKYELAVPGAFAATYPGTSDADLAGALLNGLGEVQLLGFLPTAVVDLTAGTVTPDLSPAAKALVVIFTAEQTITMRMLDMNARLKVEAGPTKYETQKAATMLAEILRRLKDRRDTILAQATGVGRSKGGFAMADRYLAGDCVVTIAGRELPFYVHELAY